jgi:hypothetical protein
MKKQFLVSSFTVTFRQRNGAKSHTNRLTPRKNLRSHVEYLASAKLEGRRTGETGATYAAGYIANMFANYKLKAGSSANGKRKAKKRILCRLSRL